MSWHRVRAAICTLVGHRWPGFFDVPCVRCGAPSPQEFI